MSSLILRGYGKRNLIVTKGMGKWRVEIRKVVPRVGLPYWEIKVFKMEVPVRGDVSFPFHKKIIVRGIVSFKELLLLLEGEEPDDLDEVLKLLDLYQELKAQLKWKKVISQEELETLKDCEEIIKRMMEKFKDEKT